MRVDVTLCTFFRCSTTAITQRERKGKKRTTRTWILIIYVYGAIVHSLYKRCINFRVHNEKFQNTFASPYRVLFDFFFVCSYIKRSSSSSNNNSSSNEWKIYSITYTDYTTVRWMKILYFNWFKRTLCQCEHTYESMSIVYSMYHLLFVCAVFVCECVVSVYLLPWCVAVASHVFYMRFALLVFMYT